MKVQWKKQSGPLLVSSCNLVQPKRGREEPTMTRATRTAEYTGATTLCLYLAFELGSNEWKLGFQTDPGSEQQTGQPPFSQPRVSASGWGLQPGPRQVRSACGPQD